MTRPGEGRLTLGSQVADLTDAGDRDDLRVIVPDAGGNAEDIWMVSDGARFPVPKRDQKIRNFQIPLVELPRFNERMPSPDVEK